MMQASAYGRLGGDPRRIETKSGKAMAVASIAVEVAGGHGKADAEPLWLGIVAFGRVGDDLLRHVKGDFLSAAGRVQRSVWQTPSGERREQLQLVAEALVSARTVRPSGGKRKPSTKGGTPDFGSEGFSE